MWRGRTTTTVVATLFLVVGSAPPLALSAGIRPAITATAGSDAGMRPAAATSTSSSSSTCWRPRAAERGFVTKMNEDRTRAGKGRLRLDPELSKAARVHTREMTEKSVLHHTSTTALGGRVTRWRLLGENVGVGGTVDSLHTAFMGSPAHRANIMLSSFNFVGVGVSEQGGRMWVTVIFENKEDPGTTLKMRRC